VLALALTVAACANSAAADRPATTVTYSAPPPRSHTVDSTGFHDNAGRTSDQDARTEESGMRATETGTDDPAARVPATPRAPTPEEEVIVSAAPPETIGRIARARCDRETACSRVGEKKRFSTGEQCVSAYRERARADIIATQCTFGIVESQLGACLAAVRQLPCDAGLDSIASLEDCQRSSLCM